MKIPSASKETKQKGFRLSTNASDSFTRIIEGFALAPSLRVMYPVKPDVNAVMSIVADVNGRGKVTSAVRFDNVNIAYSVEEYAKHAVSSFMKDIVRGECGRGAS